MTLTCLVLKIKMSKVILEAYSNQTDPKSSYDMNKKYVWAWQISRSYYECSFAVCTTEAMLLVN